MNGRWRGALACLLVGLLANGCGDAPELRPLRPDAVLVAFGDSLTAGTGAAPGAAYPDALQRRIGRRVINAGVPGEISSRGLQRLPEVLDTHAPQLLVLVHGGNDILRRLPASRTRDHLTQMVALARARQIDVVMLGVPGPHLGYGAPDYYGEVAEAAGVPVDLDALPSLMGDAAFKSDQVHYNAAGYARMARAVETLLREHGALP